MFSLKKRSFAILAVFMLAAAILLGACATTASETEKTLRVGVDDSYPPMEYKTDKNETVGFDVDFAKAIGEKLGMKVEFISTAWDGIFQALKTDKFDCIISSISITESRLVDFAMTRPYIANAQVIVVVPSDESIKVPEDLKDKKVGCQVATTADDSCETFLSKGISFDLKKYDQIIQPFSDMKAGRLDAIVVDEVVAKYYVATDSASFKISSARLTNEPIGICLKKENTELRDKIQTIVDGLKADGTLKKISEQWFAEDLTANIDAKLKQLE